MSVQNLLSTLTAVVVSSVSVVAWAYDRFETKEMGKERVERLEARLDRIEGKIDRILEREGNRN